MLVTGAAACPKIPIWAGLCYNKFMDKSETYTVKQAAEMLATTPRTIRYFCDRGLIPHLRRGRNYYRLLSTEQLDLLRVLLGMKQAGFAPSDLRRYSRLVRQGDQTATDRLAILTTRKHQLQQEIKDRQAAIDFIERQEEIFAQGSATARTGRES